MLAILVALVVQKERKLGVGHRIALPSKGFLLGWLEEGSTFKTLEELSIMELGPSLLYRMPVEHSWEYRCRGMRVWALPPKQLSP